MNIRTTRSPAAYRTMTLLLLTALGGGAGCNQISGANNFDFTRTPDEGSSSSSSGGGGGAGGGGSGSGSSSGSGGTGGSGGGGGVSITAYELSCGAGKFAAVGVYGRSGAWIDKLGLLCAPFQADGTLGATFQSSAVGGEGGSVNQGICPKNQVMVGVSIWHDQLLVYQIELHCQSITEWKKPDSTAAKVQGMGSAAATEYTGECPHGAMITGVKGTSGEYVNEATMVYSCTQA